MTSERTDSKVSGLNDNLSKPTRVHMRYLEDAPPLELDEVFKTKWTELAKAASLDEASKHLKVARSRRVLQRSRTLSAEKLRPPKSALLQVPGDESSIKTVPRVRTLARSDSMRSSSSTLSRDDSTEGSQFGSVSSEGGESGKEDKKTGKLIKKVSLRRITRDAKLYGNCPDDYRDISERVMAEKAVVNAIEALQERWQLLILMYEDCMHMNREIRERRKNRETVKRQEEIIVFTFLMSLIVVPIYAILHSLHPEGVGWY